MRVLSEDEVHACLRGSEQIGATRAGDVIISIQHGVMARVEQLVAEGAPLEQAGVLLGAAHEAGDGYLVEILEALPFPVTVPEESRVRVSRRAWPELLKMRASRCPNLRIVGWYHSHTGSGAVFSEADRFIQRFFFPADWQVACVLDTVKQETQFFQRQGRNVTPVGGFYLAAGKMPSDSAPPGAAPIMPPGPLAGGGKRSNAAGGGPLGGAPGSRPVGSASGGGVPPRAPEPARFDVPAGSTRPLDRAGSGERREASVPRSPLRQEPGLARGQGGENAMAGAPFESGPENRSSARESSDNFLRERFVERSLEKIVRLLKEPPMYLRDYIVIALLVLIAVLVVFRGSRGISQGQFDELKQRLEGVQQHLYQLEGARMDAVGTARPAPVPRATRPAPSPMAHRTAAAAPTPTPEDPTIGEGGQTPSPSADERVYVIKKGDSLWGVCEQEYKDGRLMDALMKYNQIPDPEEINVGQRLRLPPREVLEKYRSASPLALPKGGKSTRAAPTPITPSGDLPSRTP